MKHPQDGPIHEQDAKNQADQALTGHRGTPDEAERTKDDRLTGHDDDTQIDPAWQKSGDDWIHEEEG